MMCRFKQPAEWGPKTRRDTEICSGAIPLGTPPPYVAFHVQIPTQFYSVDKDKIKRTKTTFPQKGAGRMVAL